MVVAAGPITGQKSPLGEEDERGTLPNDAIGLLLALTFSPRLDTPLLRPTAVLDGPETFSKQERQKGLGSSTALHGSSLHGQAIHGSN
ncbi:uncharacterized protein N7496_009845 [Penicillium cataractarum]|uniref:Uncharacterized protein n=1 Tax=Penicillium cataractarum TaxID=2100454 RepID=A0A9W9RPS1_9EURO|nr:uncharacterized protein N7496_009845 [Penicillium cataractarum]KAJ5364132.1 hypothetical protein N7496_009845 [Penicillium cataractarum]